MVLKMFGWALFSMSTLLNIVVGVGCTNPSAVRRVPVTMTSDNSGASAPESGAVCAMAVVAMANGASAAAGKRMLRRNLVMAPLFYLIEFDMTALTFHGRRSEAGHLNAQAYST